MTAIAILSNGIAVAASRPAGTARVGVPCKLTAAAPTVANNQITGKGSIRCKTSRTVHAHIETQVQELGQWGTFGSFDDPFVQVKAGKTHRVSTGPANCNGFGPNHPMRTVLRLVALKNFRRVLVSVQSGTVEISCSGR